MPLIAQKFKLPRILDEVSGVIYNNSDSIWYANDGGHPATLYLANIKGEILLEKPIPKATNKDWEDLTQDKAGKIYIGDFGNNKNKRKDLRIYIFNLNDETLKTIQFDLPDQVDFPPKKQFRNFDMESFFWHNDYLHLFSKSKLGNNNYTTRHYRLDDSTPVQTAELIGQRDLKNRVVTSAAISANGKKVLLLSYHYKRALGFFPVSKTSIFSFTNFENDNFLSGKMTRYKVKNFIFPTQYESIDFCEDDQIIYVSERTRFIASRGKRKKLKKS